MRSIDDQQQEQAERTQMYQVLMQRFDDSELQTLCFNLGIDYDVLRGSSKADKARDLIVYLYRRERIAELVPAILKMRDDITADDFVVCTEEPLR